MPPTFEIENQFDGAVCGIDEVGRGPLAGPVVAAAAILKPAFFDHPVSQIINDSKKLSAKKRRVICKDLSDLCYSAIGIASVIEIDQHNIFQATFIAMQRAFDSLCKTHAQTPVMTLIDGKFCPNLSSPTMPVIKGDQKSLSIAAASIIAKEYRDQIMIHLSSQHPQYSWQTNAGYGTKAHIDAVYQHGITPHHRKTFKPISEVLSTTY